MTVEQIKRPEWCGGCGGVLAEHFALRQDGQTAYGGLQLTAGMVPLGKRTFGPSPTPRGRPRSDLRRMVKKPGPVTLHCLRCNAARIVVVGPDTVLGSR